jgi:hypothetical protein
MLGREPGASLLGQTCSAMAMHRFMKPGVVGRTSTRCTPRLFLLNNLLIQNT